MGDQGGFLAKLTLPVLAPIIERQRLYALVSVDNIPVSWISSPAGAGKTTLAIGSIRENGLKTIWYQFDSGDEDPASFFYHLNLAAKQANPRKRKRLPALTPEYMMGLDTFARNFFRDFFAAIKPPFVLILDNYHELESASIIHGLIRLLLTELPPGVRVIVTSRELPPALFADLRVKQKMQVLEWVDLRLSEKECAALASFRTNHQLDAEAVRELHRASEGWLTGLILMLNINGKYPHETNFLNPKSMDIIGDYFESEVLSKLDEQQQDLLTKTSILPTITPEIAKGLTGFEQADHMLDVLHKSQCFIERCDTEHPNYQYHHLFRDFLRNRLKSTTLNSDIQSLYVMAANLFESASQIEYAAELYQKAESWDALGMLCCQHGKHMLATGRLNTLDRWLSSIPEIKRVQNPWLLYWLGQCKKAFDPGIARDLFQFSCEGFDQAGDGVGAHLAWSAAVETYLGEWNEFRSVRKWLNIFDNLQRKYPDPGSPEAEVAVTMGMFVALTLRQPMPHKIAHWEEKCLRLIPALPTTDQKILLISMVCLHWSRVGELHRALSLVRQFSTMMADPAVLPLTRIIWGWNQCIYFWLTGELEEFFETYTKTLSLAQSSGIHVVDTMLHGQAAHCYLSYGKVEQVDELLEKIAANMNPNHTLHASLYNYIGAWKLLVEERYEAAREMAKTGLGLSIKAGATFVPVIQNMVVLLIAEFMSGGHQKARHYLSRIFHLADIIQVDYLKFISDLLKAWMQLEESGEAACLDSLRSAMCVASKKGMVLYPGIPPKIMSALCAVALKHSIYPEHVKHIICKLNLKPDGQARQLPEWPWRIRISTMGDFVVEVDGRPLEFGRKLQQRPLDLLKYLLSGISERTSMEQVAAAIWPDAEGDQAYNSLKITVSRLRKLLGKDVVCQKGGYILLNKACCWVDSWILHDLFAGFDSLSEKETNVVSRKVDELYQGDFLIGDDAPWALSQREDLRFRYSRMMTLYTTQLIRNDKFNETIRIAHSVLEKLPCAEPICMNLMYAYRAIDELSIAEQVYERCQTARSMMLNAEPGHQIRNLYEQITPR